MKADASDPRRNALPGLKIKIRAVRAKDPDVSFEWTNGIPEGAEQFTSGLKQIIDGFYETYWPILATGTFYGAGAIDKVEPLADGSATVYKQDQGISAITTIDKDFTPTRMKIDSPATKASIELHYIASPRPTPGDLRRVSELRATHILAESTLRIDIALDYQDVDNIHVPRHVKLTQVGAYFLDLELHDCSVNQGPADSH